MKNKILLYEELSLNAHPTLQTQVYDGWILRFANGYTNRSNSINPLYQYSLDLQTKITDCENRYFAQGLPAIYKLTDASDWCIDRALEQQEYKITMTSFVMDMELQNKNFSVGDCVLINYMDNEWLNAYCKFSCYTDKITVKQILENIKSPVIYGKVIKKGIIVACGLAVIERGFVGLQNIIVDSLYRNNGYGIEICDSLLAEAKRLGANTAYLQVVKDNYKAINLYSKLGFKKTYSYWFRIKTKTETIEM